MTPSQHPPPPPLPPKKDENMKKENVICAHSLELEHSFYKWNSSLLVV